MLLYLNVSITHSQMISLLTHKLILSIYLNYIIPRNYLFYYFIALFKANTIINYICYLCKSKNISSIIIFFYCI